MGTYGSGLNDRGEGENIGWVGGGRGKAEEYEYTQFNSKLTSTPLATITTIYTPTVRPTATNTAIRPIFGFPVLFNRKRPPLLKYQ